MRSQNHRIVEIGREQLASLVIAWKHPRVSQLDIVLNPNLKSTLARWIPRSNILEVNAKVKSRSALALREIISHEAAHVVVWDRSGRAARPHGPEWAALMRAVGFEPRAVLVRCGYRECPFCNPDPDRVFMDAELVVGLWDACPVAARHALVVTRRHVASWFDATASERQALTDAIQTARREILRRHAPDGFKHWN